jgi:hypothetical protein
MKNPYVFITVLFIIFSAKLSAQLKVEAELRPRLEYRYGYKKHPADTSFPAYLVSQRSRIGLTFSNERLTTKVAVQDVRYWGDEKLKDDVSTIGLYEAWAEWKALDSLSVRIGRQEFVYDNDRFLSNSNWNLKGLTHDAVLFKFHYNGWKIDFASAFNEYNDPVFGTNYNDAAVADNYKTLNFLWVSKKFGNILVSGLALLDGFQKPGLKNAVYLRQTYGLNLTLPLVGQNLQLRGFYQGGKNKSGIHIGAWYINPELTLKLGGKITFSPGLEVFSGQDATDTANTNVNYFSNLYGSSHSFNGSMDYFTDIPKHTKNAGLTDGYFKLMAKVSKNLNLRADYHYFALQNNYVKSGELINKYLGTELDFSFRYDPAKEFSLQGGYSLMFAGASMEIVNGGNADRIGKWAWISCTFRPSFLFKQP